MAALLKEVCQSKIKSNDRRCCYCITPNDGWYDAVDEARGHGISIKCFGDTLDKVVIHPGHMGYKFDYHWGKGEWTSQSCWEITIRTYDKYDDMQVTYETVDSEIINKANFELVKFGTYLVSLGYCVWFVNISGDGKGHLSTTIENLEINSDPNIILKNSLESYCERDKVLFVFNFNPNKYI